MRLVENPFSIDHLPFGIVRFAEQTHLAVRLGDQAISLEKLRAAEWLGEGPLTPTETMATSLNPLLEVSEEALAPALARLTNLLVEGDHLHLEGATLDLSPYPDDDPRVLNPIDAGDFVDFYCSRHHAYRVGCLFRGPENALPEQYFDLPIGYHGRSSTLRQSGQAVHRPSGITAGPSFGPTQRLDYELELGYLLRPCDRPLSPDQAAERIFGVVLLNDWSARDIQAYEYRPLGPFLGKSFATSVGAWVTPWSALQRWRQSNTDSDHPVLPHLQERGAHHLDLPLWSHLRACGGEEAEMCQTNSRHLAWSPAQMLAHLTSNGTIVRAGDLIASGTISGPEEGAEGCLLERTEGGKKPLRVSPDVERKYFHDGDTVTLLGGYPGLGLAPCRAQVLAAPSS